jgi:predicted Zn-dependent protease
MAILSEREARELVERILEIARADETWISLSSREGGNARFANNAATTAGEVEDVTVQVTAAFGTRRGAAQTNGMDEDALRDVVRRAEEAARLAPEDPEHVPALAPAEYPAPPGFHTATAEFGPDERAAASARAIDEAEARGTKLAGFLENYATGSATANSAGLFAYHAETSLEYTNTARTPDGRGSGWAGVRLHDAAALDAAAHARVAGEKAAASRDPRPLEAGYYPVILEPTAVAVLAGSLVGSMDARRAEEGRSYLSAPNGGTKLGERLLAPSVTIVTDPLHDVAPGRAWSGEQLPARRTVWFERGVVRTLPVGRYWAGKSGVEPVPSSTNLIFEGEDRSLEDLIRSTERAVLVTRFWYIRSLNPRDLSLTGLTRDGTFWVENGRIAHAVNNFRWNESPVRLFAAVEAMSRSERVANQDSVVSPSWVPAVRAATFHFASVSQAV